MQKRYVAYYRISTKKNQSLEGLGVSAQIKSVKKFIGKSGQLIDEFREAETGTRKKRRVEIYKAIDKARAENATLIVAKLDRLSRDVEFTSALYHGGVDFICVDNPNANKLTIQLLSVIAENEAEMISKRIKEALAIKKDRIAKGQYRNKNGSRMKPTADGTFRLGNPNGFGNYQTLGIEKIKENARLNKANVQAMDIICDGRKRGMTYLELAQKLNGLHYQTRRGKLFYPATVKRLADRCGES